MPAVTLRYYRTLLHLTEGFSRVERYRELDEEIPCDLSQHDILIQPAPTDRRSSKDTMLLTCRLLG